MGKHGEKWWVLPRGCGQPRDDGDRRALLLSHYERLGVAEAASADTIRSAYRIKMQVVHPDRHQGAEGQDIADAEEETRLLILAYSVLSDPHQRVAYDAQRRSAAHPHRAARDGSSWGSPPSGQPHAARPERAIDSGFVVKALVGSVVAGVVVLGAISVTRPKGPVTAAIGPDRSSASMAPNPTEPIRTRAQFVQDCVDAGRPAAPCGCVHDTWQRSGGNQVGLDPVQNTKLLGAAFTACSFDLEPAMTKPR